MRPEYLIDGPPGAETIFDGESYLYFGGTGYFGLHKHPEIIAAAEKALRKYGTGSATTRGGLGTSPQVLELEREATAYFGTEDAVYLATGYLSDMAGLQALCAYTRVDAIFIDEFAHFSHRDGAATTGKPIFAFRNGDNNHLAEQLEAHLKPGQKPLVVTDGIFSIRGALPPIPEYLALMETYDGNIWVDDAHGVGILGSNGRGVYDHYELSSERLFYGGTLAKAFGGFGGIVPGSRKFIGKLREGDTLNGGSYSTAGVASSLAGIRWVGQHPEARQALWHNARYLKIRLQKLGLVVEDNHIPIVSWVLDSADEMKKVQQELMKQHIAIQYSHYIGAGKKGVLRAVVFSTHTEAQIDKLAETLDTLL